MNLTNPLESNRLDAARSRFGSRQLEAAAAAAILLFAAGVRLIGIDSLPPGLFQDEAVNGVNVFTILAGHPQMYYGEREPLFMYTLALVSLVLNPTPLALRVTAALVSVAGVASAGALARRLFGTRVGLLTAFGAASSVWLTALGRTSFRANEVPVFEALGLAVLWRATESGRSRDYAAGGAILGLSLYTYLAARFIPILLVFFAFTCFFGHRSWMLKQVRGFLIAAMAAIAILLPLGYYAIRHPLVILGRPDQVALPGGSEFLPAFIDSSIRTLGMVVIRGDVTWRHNLSNAPVFDPVNGFLFFVGLFLALRRRRPADLLILTTLIVMLLPGMLSVDSPHFLRTIGATPALYTLWAVGLLTAVRFVAARIGSSLSHRRPNVAIRSWPVAALVGATLVWTGYRDVWSYFVVYAQSVRMPGSYNVNLVAAGQVLAADPLWKTSRENVYITDTYQDSIGSLAYWVYPRMTPGEKDHWVDEASLGTYFTQDELIPLPLAPSLYLLSPDSPSTEVEAALGSSIQRSQELTDGKLLLGRAIWADPVRFSDTTIAQFDALALESASALPSSNPPSPDSGQWTLRVQWRVTRQPTYPPSIFVHVEDEQGHLIAQADQEMHLSLDHWRIGQRLVSIRSIELPIGTLPGHYFVSVGVYDKSSGQRETILVDNHPAVPPSIATIGLALPVLGVPPRSDPARETTVAPGLTLVGVSGWPPTVEAGARIPIVLTWQNQAPIPDDRQVTVVLRQTDGLRVSSSTEPIGASDYPTSLWPTGTFIRQIVDLPVSPLASGPSSLSVHVGPAWPTPGPDVVIDVGSIAVSAAQHVFAAPTPANPLDVRFVDAGRLIGWSAGTVTHPGEPVHLSLIWAANGPSAAAYTVFVHLLDASGAIVGQRDEEPSHGTRSTTGWVNGEYVVDQHDVDVPPGTVPGSYRVEVGLYEARTGQRVPLVSGADSAVIGEIEVAPR